MNVFYAHDDDVTYHLRKVLKDDISYKASTAYQSAASAGQMQPFMDTEGNEIIVKWQYQKTPKRRIMANTPPY